MKVEVKRHPVQEIDIHTDTREILANCDRERQIYGLDDMFIVDVDAHHVELDSWSEILDQIDDPVVKFNAQAIAKNWPYASNLALSAHAPGLTLQDVGGRIPHQAQLAEHVEPIDGQHRDLTLIHRAMNAMSLNYQIVFPQPMLAIGMHPSAQVETQLVKAYNRWFVKNILEKGERIKSMLPLPFRDPAACMEMIETYADHPNVVGFLITSQRMVNVGSSAYMPVYAELERRNLPIGFHAGPDYQMEKQVNRFLSVHALSFVTCNMVHLTNWIMNAIPERFPDLNVIWIESGIAWVPFMMQRLDHEWILRQSDAPQLKKRPSEYMKNFHYTTQPLEVTDMKMLEATFEMIDAKNTLLYSSDWPHWDFDTPGRIAGLPFLDDAAKRNILGENARKLFNL